MIGSKLRKRREDAAREATGRARLESGTQDWSLTAMIILLGSIGLLQQK